MTDVEYYGETVFWLAKKRKSALIYLSLIFIIVSNFFALYYNSKFFRSHQKGL